jgi:hypothetical protein
VGALLYCGFKLGRLLLEKECQDRANEYDPINSIPIAYKEITSKLFGKM